MSPDHETMNRIIIEARNDGKTKGRQLEQRRPQYNAKDKPSSCELAPRLDDMRHSRHCAMAQRKSFPRCMYQPPECV